MYGVRDLITYEHFPQYSWGTTGSLERHREQRGHSCSYGTEATCCDSFCTCRLISIDIMGQTHIVLTLSSSLIVLGILVAMYRYARLQCMDDHGCGGCSRYSRRKPSSNYGLPLIEISRDGLCTAPRASALVKTQHRFSADRSSPASIRSGEQAITGRRS
jgi:hypothetical protein